MHGDSAASIQNMTQHVVNNRRHMNRLLILLCSLGFSKISLYVPKWTNVTTSISMEVEINHSGSSTECKKIYQQKENIMFYIFEHNKNMLCYTPLLSSS